MVEGDPGAYYERVDEGRFRPTARASGAWNVAEQHISPLNGLVVHEVQRRLAEREDDDRLISRLAVEILGVLLMDVFEIHVEVVRPGRTIELLEATVRADDRAAVRTRIWRLAAFDTASVAGGAPDPLPAPDEPAGRSLAAVWPGGYVASLDVRFLDPPEPGRARAWVATDVELVAGESASDLARFVGLIDTANGLSVREPNTQWLFPNVDLAVHLHRPPIGRVVGFDTQVVFGPSGQGVTTSVLHDREGAVGTAHQLLTVRRR